MDFLRSKSIKDKLLRAGITMVVVVATIIKFSYMDKMVDGLDLKHIRKKKR